MPYEITWERRGVHRRYFGRLTDGEFLDAVAEVEGSIRFYDIRYSILDFLGLEQLVIHDTGFIAKTAALNVVAARSNPGIKVAVVAVSPQVRKLAEEYKANPATPYTTEVFRTMEEARTWVAIADLPKHDPRKAFLR